jgi:hypothetical protein
VVLISDAERAYAAGFFDGEGTIGIVTGGRPARLHLEASQSSPIPLLWLQERWQGSVAPYKPDPKYTRRRQAFRWRLGSRAALRFLMDVRPWLMVKGAQADIAIAFQQARTPSGYLRSRPLPERAANIAGGEEAKLRLVAIRKEGAA